MKNTWRFTGNELKYIREVIDSGFGSSTSGSMNNRFEQAFAEKVGVKYAVTFNSGTGTLHAALYALGVGYGDEVIIPPLTVISNLDVVLSQNAVPVFADVDYDTFNIDPKDIERKITSRTKAIMPVPLYGLPCDWDAIMAISRKHNIPVINDAAQAHMSTYKGRDHGRICHITSYSLENSKHITTGDGGIVVTDNEEWATKMRKFGSLGYASLPAADGRIRRVKDIFQNPNHKRHDAFGYNYRMPEVAAALGLGQLERVDWFIDMRVKIARLYLDAMKECDYLIPQKVPSDCVNTYYTVGARYERTDVSWFDFRQKYIDFGGDGIYAAWALIYDETLFTSGAWRKHCPPLYDKLDYKRPICPVADRLQPKLMQFVNNYGSLDEAAPKIEALQKTIRHFK